jgi:hypothetical protein
MTTITQTAAETAASTKTLGTLKTLDLINGPSSTPVPAAVPAYYLTQLAKGSGPNGTFLTTDFFGSAAGIPYNDYLTTVTSTLSTQINAGNVSSLATIYSQMVSVVTSVFGAPPSIIIPSGPAAGTYATYDAALVALITAANAAVGTAISTMGANTTATLNTAWTTMTTHSANEDIFQALASIDYTTLTAGAQLPITAFIPALAGYGQDRQVGMAFDFLTSIANTANQYGQAMVGALIDGGNKAGLESIGLSPDTAVPSQPNTAPPIVSIAQYEYDPTEARAQVQT